MVYTVRFQIELENLAAVWDLIILPIGLVLEKSYCVGKTQGNATAIHLTVCLVWRPWKTYFFVSLNWPLCLNPKWEASFPSRMQNRFIVLLIFRKSEIIGKNVTQVKKKWKHHCKFAFSYFHGRLTLSCIRSIPELLCYLTIAKTMIIWPQQIWRSMSLVCIPPPRPTLSQFQSLDIRRSANFMRIRNVMRRILKLKSCGRVCKDATKKKLKII